MSSQLFANLSAILEEKNTNCIPANIRADKTIFGIKGSAPITFATVDEMESNKDFPENTLAIVYGVSYIGTYKLDGSNWTQIGDTTEGQEIMNTLNAIASSIDEYEGTGGSDDEINAVLDVIKGSVTYDLSEIPNISTKNHCIIEMTDGNTYLFVNKDYNNLMVQEYSGYTGLTISACNSYSAGSMGTLYKYKLNADGVFEEDGTYYFGNYSTNYLVISRIRYTSANIYNITSKTWHFYTSDNNVYVII